MTGFLSPIKYGSFWLHTFVFYCTESVDVLTLILCP